MAISERLQQRINNLTNSMASPMGTIGGGTGAISDKEMEMFRDASPRLQDGLHRWKKSEWF